MRDSSLSWQAILAQGFISAEKLLSFLKLPLENYSHLAEKEFSSRIPLHFANLMEKGNPCDPLLMQVLAINDELMEFHDFIEDPLYESKFNVVPGLIHKYHGRVLLTVTGSCAINCRYCFRRYFPYHDNNPGRAGWIDALNYIRKDTSINEVILSGGDPLLANDLLLSHLFKNIADIAHVTTIRIHTRIPIVLPERICDELLAIFKNSRCKVVVVLHSNHPRELSLDVGNACFKLHSVGCHLLNQSVLLRGINDDVDILISLSHALFAFGVMPYYLHLLDKTRGTKHFEVQLTDALDIFQKLQSSLPGYLVPRLAREKSGAKNKTLYGLTEVTL